MGKTIRAYVQAFVNGSITQSELEHLLLLHALDAQQGVLMSVNKIMIWGESDERDNDTP